MFKRKEINLEDVRSQLTRIVKDTIANYRELIKVHPEKKNQPFTSSVDQIDAMLFLPQFVQIYTDEVAKYVFKNRANGSLTILIGEEHLKPLSPDVVDLYIMALVGITDQVLRHKLLDDIFGLAGTNYHNNRAEQLILAKKWAEAEIECRDALEFAVDMEQFLSYKMKAMYYLGISLQWQEKDDEAKKTFLRALEVYKQLPKNEAKDMQVAVDDIKVRFGTAS